MCISNSKFDTAILFYRKKKQSCNKNKLVDTGSVQKINEIYFSTVQLTYIWEQEITKEGQVWEVGGLGQS